jgi:hypothetical protein
MTLDRVRVWKFDDAPADLRVLHKGKKPPKWLAFIPSAIHGTDLEEAIVAHTPVTDLDKYKTDAGDVVYVGSSDHEGPHGRGKD